MKKVVSDKDELASIGKNALEQAHTIMNRIAVFGSAAPEVRRLIEAAHKEERRLTNTEMGVMSSLLQLIEEVTGQIEKDMKGILQFGKGLQYEMESIDINKFLDDLIGTMEARGKFVITYSVEFCPEIKKLVEIDRHHIANCIFDLVKNAVEANATEVTIMTSTETTPERQFVEISVINDGEPIPAEIMTHIFDFAFTTKKKKGNGVGLAQVRRIVEAHGGHVDVRSSSQSTAFRIFLPI